jgi:thiamine kinase-like enzyme
LASLFPDSLPTIVASRPDWNAWLALESVGSPLDSDPTAWATAAENLALLQLSSLRRTFDLIDSGCKDLRPCRLVDLVDPFFDTMAELMKQQTKIHPAPLSRQELDSLAQHIISAIAEIQDSAIPVALGHLDMNPDNVLVSGGRCVFLDWAEAYVGPPLFAFQYLLEHWRQLHKEDLRNEACLVACYAKHWTHFASPREIATTLRVVPLLAAFTYAVSSHNWRNHRDIQPTAAGYLRSQTRRMKREVDAWQQRRPACVL